MTTTQCTPFALGAPAALAHPPVPDHSRWISQRAELPSRSRSTSFGWRRLGRLLMRLAGFGWVVLGMLGDYAVHLGLGNKRQSIQARCAWLSRWSRRMLRVLDVRVTCHGDPPASGLLVSNHLGYLDILVLASVQPLVFVAKSEVRRWPLLGLLAHLGGTLFIQREKRSDVARLNDEFTPLVNAGVVVAMFPEGTSSGGQSVLPFFASLLAPAAEKQWPVTPAALDYALRDGSMEDEVCYWRDMTFLPHFLNLLTKREVLAVVNYGTLQPACPDRKKLARQLHWQVKELKAQWTPVPA